MNPNTSSTPNEEVQGNKTMDFTDMSFRREEGDLNAADFFLPSDNINPLIKKQEITSSGEPTDSIH